MLNHRVPNLTFFLMTILVYHSIFLLPIDANDEQEPIELDKIVVTPGKFSIYEGTTPQISISKEEIEQFPLIDNDIMRSGHIFPGVIANDYSARFSVRGGEKDGVAVRLDGIELHNPYHLQDFGGAISLVGLNLIQSADLLMGGFPAEFGQKMSGVFDIETKTPNPEKVSANFGLDFINATVMIEGPLTEKGGWLLSARRGYIDLILALIDIDEMYNPQYADLYGKFVYQLTEADSLTFNGLYGWDKNRIRVDDIENNLDSLYNNSTLWLKWRHAFGSSHWSDVYLFGGISLQERISGEDDFDNRHFQYIGSKVEFTSNIFSQHTIRSGVEWRWSKSEYDYFARERIEGVNNFSEIDAEIENRGNEIKVFLQDEWQLHSKLALNIGGRYIIQDFRDSDIQNYEVGPRVMIAFRPIENLVFRSAWGIYHQPVDLMSLPVEDDRQSVGRAEQSTHYIIGCEYTIGNNFLLRLEGYYKDYVNLVGRHREFGRQTQVFAAPESAEAKGFDVFATHAVSSRLTWGLGYAYGIAEETSDIGTIFRETDRRHSLFLSSSHQITSSWHLYASWRYHSGSPKTPLEHKLTKLTDGNPACDRIFGETHSERLPPYHSLDFRITKRNPYKAWTLSWYFQILNLYNRSNLDQYAFAEIKDEDTGNLIDCTVEPEPQLPIIPTLGLTITF